MPVASFEPYAKTTLEGLHDDSTVTFRQLRPSGWQEVQIIADDDGSDCMLLDTGMIRLSVVVAFPSLPQYVGPNGSLLTIKLGNKSVQHVLRRNRKQFEAMITPSEFREVSIDTVDDAEVHDGDAGQPPFIEVVVESLAEGGVEIHKFSESGDDDVDDSDITCAVTEINRKRGYLTCTTATKRARTRAPPAPRKGWLYATDTLSSWSLRAATHEQVVRRAGCRSAGLSRLLSLGVTLPDALQEEHDKFTAHSTPGTAYVLSESEDEEEEEDEKQAAPPLPTAPASTVSLTRETLARVTREWTAEAEPLAEEPDSPLAPASPMAPDVAPSSPPASPRCPPPSSTPWLQARREQNVARNQRFLETLCDPAKGATAQPVPEEAGGSGLTIALQTIQAVRHRPSPISPIAPSPTVLCTAPAAVEGLTELCKDTVFYERSLAWFEQHGLCATAAIVEAGIEDEFLSAVGAHGLFAERLMRKRLREA